MTTKLKEILEHLKSVSSASSDYESLKSGISEKLGGSPELEGLADVICWVFACCEEGTLKVDRSKYKEDDNSLFCRDIRALLSGYYVKKTGSVVQDVDASDVSLQYYLLQHSNSELPLSEYLRDKHYASDIDKLYDLIVGTPDGVGSEWNEKVLEDIINNEVASAAHQCVPKVEQALECLTAMYSTSFGLYPFHSVVTFYPSRPSTEKDAKYILPGMTLFRGVSVLPKNRKGAFKLGRCNVDDFDKYTALCSDLQNKFAQLTDVNFGRTYDFDKILSGAEYYPFASAVTYSTASELELDYFNPPYGDFAWAGLGCASWEEYVRAALRGSLTQLYARFIYKALEFYGKATFTSEEFLKDYEFSKSQAYNRYFGGILTNVTKAVTNLTASVCTSCVLSRVDSDVLYKLKVCVFNSAVSGSSVDTSDLFGDYFSLGIQDISYQAPIKQSITSIGASIYEFTFCRDVELMDKKPLFGYQAAKLFQSQHKSIDLNNILIGEYITGEPAFATQGGSINLQGNLFHRFSAGTRSGKGVMTMNVLASGVASGAALFYVDRKPDMGSELGFLSEGDMFLVNGGDLKTSEDVHGTFVKGKGYGPMLSMYSSRDKSEYKRDYLTAVFGSDFGDEWKGKFGDFIYMKAMIFCLSLIASRIYFLGMSAESLDAEVVNDLALNENVMVVIDEITNWHHSFESEFFPTYPKSGKTPVGAVIKYVDYTLGVSADNGDAIEAIKEGLSEDDKKLLNDQQMMYQQAMQAYEASEKSHKDLAELMKVKSAYEKAVAKVQKSGKGSDKDLGKKLYWSTFFDKYSDGIGVLSAIKNAGIKPDMTLKNDVFLIGQFITGIPCMGPLYTRLSSGDLAIKGTIYDGIVANTEIGTEDLDASYMLGYAEAFSCDWFTGRNVVNKEEPAKSTRYPNFGGKVMREDVASWIHARGNWMYIPGGTNEQYRHDPPDYNNMVLFKPYLVLNTNDEPVPAAGEDIYSEGFKKEHDVDKTKYKYVYGAVARVGIAEWKKIRPDLVVPGVALKDSWGKLEPGIGLKGLIEEYKRTNPGCETWSFDKSCLSRSKEIADAICAKFGYSSYMDYLLDVSPKGIIGAKDIIAVYENPELASSPEARYKVMFPRYANTGNLGLLSKSLESAGASADEDEDDAFNPEDVGFGDDGDDAFIPDEPSDQGGTSSPEPEPAPNPVYTGGSVYDDMEGWDSFTDEDEEDEEEDPGEEEPYEGPLEDPYDEPYDEPVDESVDEPDPNVGGNFVWTDALRRSAAKFIVKNVAAAIQVTDATLLELMQEKAYNELLERGY